MPSKLKRYQEAGDFHFLTFSCHDRLPYFANATACNLFERVLEQTRQRYVFYVFGYIVMPEHVHLLVSEPKRESLSRAVQALKTSVAKQSKQKPFWLPRYYDFNVYANLKRTEKLRYLHRNPVARGLVTRAQDWPWSSFRHYATGVEGTVQIESTWTAAKRTGLKLPEVYRGTMDTTPP
jgi:putative transposase